MLIVGAVNAQKPKLAVMDFVAGAGLYQNDVKGLSDMLINSLFNTGRFKLIESGIVQNRTNGRSVRCVCEKE